MATTGDPIESEPYEAPATLQAHHRAAHIIGRIQKHGTQRIAQTMHTRADACQPGPRILPGSAFLKVAVPAAGLALLTALSSSAAHSTPRADAGQDDFFSAGAGTTGMPALPKPHVLAVPAPTSTALILLGGLAWLAPRRWFRPS